MRKLYSRIEASLTAGTHEINLEAEHPLPTLEDFEARDFVSCDMQDHLSFDVDLFEEKTLSYVCFNALFCLLLVCADVLQWVV